MTATTMLLVPVVKSQAAGALMPETISVPLTAAAAVGAFGMALVLGADRQGLPAAERRGLLELDDDPGRGIHWRRRRGRRCRLGVWRMQRHGGQQGTNGGKAQQGMTHAGLRR